MNLSSDRLDVAEGETIRIVFLVTTPEALVDARGGLPSLKHEIEDVGFRDVFVTDAPPAWGVDIAKPTSLDWLLWVEATAVRAASLSRSLTEDLNVLQAWAAPAEDPPSGAAGAGYAVVWFHPSRLFGRLRVFGVAYPIPCAESSPC